MGEWPEGWFRGPAGEQGAAAAGGGASADKTVRIPADQYAAGQGGAVQGGAGQGGTVQGGAGQGGAVQGGAGQGGAVQGGAGQRPVPPGSWPAQPPVSTAGGAGYGARPEPGSTARYSGVAAPARSPARPSRPGLPRLVSWRRWLRPRRVFSVLAVVVALLLVAGIGTYFYLNSKLTRGNFLVNYVGRPGPGSGTNWLIAGSDSRQGLTRKQERRLSTGHLDTTGFGRSDTILVLHIPAGGGRPLLISIPRDSYVHIPGYGMDKINAAFTFGGPALLARTVQSDTGLYINHFMDIGFGGFVRVVDAVGGVRMCLVHRLHDHASGLHLSKGCHVLNGAEALAYVRDRHDFATQDLQRIQDQRIFLSALLKKVTSLGVILNPVKAIPAASGVAGTLTVDNGTSLYQLLGVAEAMRNPMTTTVPIATANYLTPAGDAILWSSDARRLFNDLQTGQPVPKNLITGSQQGT